jgi:hypothetical protein
LGYAFIGWIIIDPISPKSGRTYLITPGKEKQIVRELPTGISYVAPSVAIIKRGDLYQYSPQYFTNTLPNTLSILAHNNLNRIISSQSLLLLTTVNLSINIAYINTLPLRFN